MQINRTGGLTKFSDHFQAILDKIEIKYNDALFEPDWKQLLDYRCPVCACKLYKMRKAPRWYCKSRKNKHTFTIPDAKLTEIIRKR